MNDFQSFKVVSFLLLCALHSYGVSEEASSWLEDDRFKLALGTFVTDYDSDFRISSSSLGIGTRVSLEEDLGVDDSNTIWRFDGHYRLAARHRLEFSYFDMSRDGTAITSFPIIIDDTLFLPGSTLKTDLEYKVYKLAYAYSIWQTDSIDFSLSAGAYSFDLGLDVGSNRGRRQQQSSFSSFPMFGAHFEYRVSQAIFFASSFEYFTIDESDFEGELTDILITLEYRLFDHLGVGAGYNAVSIFAEDSKSNDELDYEYDGLLAYLTLSF